MGEVHRQRTCIGTDIPSSQDNLNNLVEQDHRTHQTTGETRHGLLFVSHGMANTQGYEVIHMLRKGQMQGVNKGDNSSQRVFIAELFGVAA